LELLKFSVTLFSAECVDAEAVLTKRHRLLTDQGRQPDIRIDTGIFCFMAGHWVLAILVKTPPASTLYSLATVCKTSYRSK